MQSQYEIDTPRLRLRPLCDSDGDELHRLFTDPGVRRFLWDDQVIPPEQTKDVLATNVSLFREHGFGLWGVRLRDDGRLKGFCGYWFFREPPELELLYGIEPNCWGRGYAPEAARAVVQYGFEVLGFSEIQASMDVPNLASMRVVEKLGFAFLKKDDSGVGGTLYYRLRRRGAAHSRETPTKVG